MIPAPPITRDKSGLSYASEHPANSPGFRIKWEEKKAETLNPIPEVKMPNVDEFPAPYPLVPDGRINPPMEVSPMPSPTPNHNCDFEPHATQIDSAEQMCLEEEHAAKIRKLDKEDQQE